MQLGARWRVGEPPHRAVPETLHTAIAAQEAQHPEASAWTLTFLEGRPRCALDAGPTVTLDAHGLVRVEDDSAGPGAAGGSDDDPDSQSPDAVDPDDEDWL